MPRPHRPPRTPPRPSVFALQQLAHPSALAARGSPLRSPHPVPYVFSSLTGLGRCSPTRDPCPTPQRSPCATVDNQCASAEVSRYVSPPITSLASPPSACCSTPKIPAPQTAPRTSPAYANGGRHLHQRHCDRLLRLPAAPAPSSPLWPGCAAALWSTQGSPGLATNGQRRSATFDKQLHSFILSALRHPPPSAHLLPG